MKNIWLRVTIHAAPEKVYEAVTTPDGLAGWWCPDTSAKPEIGSTARFSFSPDYFKEMKITALDPFKHVQWLCLKAYEDWIGTTITFDIEPHKNGTALFFHHDGWKEYSHGYAACSYDWAMFIRSLKMLCETGKGLPNPHQYE